LRHFFILKKYITVISSPLGNLRLLATEEGLTELQFVQDAKTSKPILNPILELTIGELDEYFNGKRIKFDIPLLPEGTKFQQRVWQQLTHIPFGYTHSYKQLAIDLGDEKCIRAAGTANGKNPIPIIIPCHRVIGMNGTLVGYSGGLDKKQWLLEHEQKIAHGVVKLF
jgi:methylated-DNA-[protein]-cysteine S-methyltransferase